MALYSIKRFVHHTTATKAQLSEGKQTVSMCKWTSRLPTSQKAKTSTD